MVFVLPILFYSIVNNPGNVDVYGCCCDRTMDSNLWVLALSYFAQKEENCKQQLLDVLTHILAALLSVSSRIIDHGSNGSIVFS